MPKKTILQYVDKGPIENVENNEANWEYNPRLLVNPIGYFVRSHRVPFLSRLTLRHWNRSDTIIVHN